MLTQKDAEAPLEAVAAEEARVSRFAASCRTRHASGGASSERARDAEAEG